MPALPLVILANPRSGSGDKDAALEAATGALATASHPYEICELNGSAEAACRRAARRAADWGGALVAAGGDGTVNAAANAARDAGVPLGLLPMGTFNHFAREHSIPDEPAAAAGVLMAGATRPVPLMGELNGRLFCNNAGFGLYTEAIRSRERAKQRFGRFRVVAMATTVSTLLAGREPFTLHVIADHGAAVARTSTVVVFCSPLQLETLGLDAEGCSRAGALTVAALGPTRLRDRLRLLLRSAQKQIHLEDSVKSFCTTDLEVRTKRREIEVAIDGETVRMRQPLRFRAVPEAVRLIVPDR